MSHFAYLRNRSNRALALSWGSIRMFFVGRADTKKETKTMTIRMTNQRQIRLSYIARMPGASAATIDRAVRTARGGHASMYNALARDMRAGLVRRVVGPVRGGDGYGLALTAKGAELVTVAS